MRINGIIKEAQEQLEELKIKLNKTIEEQEEKERLKFKIKILKERIKEVKGGKDKWIKKYV